MPKGGGKIQGAEQLKPLPIEGFSTGAFSLKRATPARTTTGTGSGAASLLFPSLVRGTGFQDAGGENELGKALFAPGGSLREPASGPLSLTRTDDVVPQGELGLLSQTRRLAPEIRALSTQAAGQFGQSRSRLEGLLAETRPGFGNVTQARVAAIDRNRSRTLGNLRTAFGKRNVLGASFAQGDIRQADQEFAQLEAEARAESAVQEIDLSLDIIQNIGSLDAQTFSSLSQGFQQQLQQLQQEQGILAQRAQRELEELRIGGALITGSNQVAASLSVAQAQLQASQAAGAGELFGTILGTAATVGVALI